MDDLLFFALGMIFGIALGAFLAVIITPIPSTPDYTINVKTWTSNVKLIQEKSGNQYYLFNFDDKTIRSDIK